MVRGVVGVYLESPSSSSFSSTSFFSSPSSSSSSSSPFLSASAIDLIIASALRVIFLPITFRTLFCCNISRDTLSGSESESTTPLMKPR